MLVARAASTHVRAGGGGAPSSSSGLSSRARASFATSLATLSSSPIVELRHYQLHPSAQATYTRRTIESAPLRKSRLPLAFFGFPETGSLPLGTAVHAYHYPGGLPERSEMRASLAGEEEWKRYLGDVKGCMMSQSSGIFVEAPLVDQFEGIDGLQHWAENDATEGGGKGNDGGKGIVELRKYQLRLGYDAVPEFLRLYLGALPSKLDAAETHPTTRLVTLLVSDVGSLNTVYEVWKHGGVVDGEANGNGDQFCGMRAMEQSRVASRGATEWRKGITEIALLATTFDTTVLRPSEFSPLQ